MYFISIFVRKTRQSIILEKVEITVMKFNFFNISNTKRIALPVQLLACVTNTQKLASGIAKLVNLFLLIMILNKFTNHQG